MIMRRLGQGIKDQDWFVVVLEILIVVSGIFIGLQVDDWNEQRKERLIERQYLERLSADLRSDIIDIERNIARSQQRQAYGELLMKSITNPALVEEDPSLFMVALVHAGFTLSPGISDHTFEEIKSSGHLSIIRNTDVRSALTRYYKTIEDMAQWSYLREQKQTEYIQRSTGIQTYEQMVQMWSGNEGRLFSLEEAQLAYNNMLARPDFLEWLPITAIRIQETSTYKSWLQEAQDLLQLIEVTLEKG